ncbi:Bifunctional heparan sulfate N-deacetylase/N-sulfotransferase [Trichoplax sp. H2]|nr:Bifunctional heparan sulfate N-deacetylase/N-sulfotransferase [Trichoplax sp. H2]|eukprot:RDD38773.1 Bifunctional heparan sulfate N-deacetylase/N-sulfotransferase [Trichoplax sp. H2]
MTKTCSPHRLIISGLVLSYISLTVFLAITNDINAYKWKLNDDNNYWIVNGSILRQTSPKYRYNHRLPLISDGIARKNPLQLLLLSSSDSRKQRSTKKVKILIISRRNKLNSFAKGIATAIEANKLDYSITVGDNLPQYLLNRRHFKLIIFDSLKYYVNLSQRNKLAVTTYCKEQKRVGILVFANNESVHHTNIPILSSNQFLPDVASVRIKSPNPILRLTRDGGNVTHNLPNRPWTVFNNYTHMQPILYINSKNGQQYVGGLLDDGKDDNIKRVFFGNCIDFWLIRLLFLDAIAYLSNGVFQRQLSRWLQVDVDDVFVGKKGIRMTDEDVNAMLKGQEMIRKNVDNFKFMLGFSGHYFMKGLPTENRGDIALISNASKFWWFCHMWKHTKPHLFQTTELLIADMERSRNFATRSNLPIVPGYSVSPHHSGIYPAYEPLYNAWKRVWNITVTTTEEYHHLNPAHKRKGFIHKNIQVLPRQTCGLFTKTLHFKTYPGGMKRLNQSIFGGELFRTLTDNIICIFMTHMPNYANDRMAIYTFVHAIDFLKRWTNIKLSSAPPLELGQSYFRLYPDEKDPLWLNPCTDKRHKAIWPFVQGCKQLPSMIIVGPQKTGTTALSLYLSLHPKFKPNKASKRTFEEVQFFNDNNYRKGLKWYMEFFPPIESSLVEQSIRYFEKSATYYDRALIPKRMNALLPDVDVIIILSDPVKRAYSWYQHMKNHSHPAALNYSFYDVITNKKQDRLIKQLQDRCIRPGKYVIHLERWLDYYHPSHVIIVDGKQLIDDPIQVMADLQIKLKVNDILDYSMKLQFDQRKGYYCVKRERGRNKCLGRSKGRKYPPMDKDSEMYLRNFYRPYNIKLKEVLESRSLAIPTWLKEQT